jgi:hypothetical protein
MTETLQGTPSKSSVSKQVLLPACCNHPNPRTNLSAAGRTHPKEEISFKVVFLLQVAKAHV